MLRKAGRAKLARMPAGDRWIRSWRRPVHPGEFLESRYLKPLRISQQQLALELGISRRRINELVKRHRGISPDTAIRLSLYFHTDPGFWLALQSAWDIHRAWTRFTLRTRRMAR